MGEKVKKNEFLEQVARMLDDRIADLKPKLIGDSNAGEAKDFSDNKSELKFTARKASSLIPEDEFSFLRILNAKATGNWNNARYEKWAVEETEKKALSWADGSSGGYFVGHEFLPQEFVEHYKAVQVCRQAGMRVLPCTGAPVEIPKISSGVTAYWPSQNATITKSDVTPAQLKLTPNVCAALSQLSMTLLKTSAGAAENIIRTDMAESLGVKIDAAVLEGSGSGEPTGMSNTSSINTVTAGEEAITVADLRDMELDLQTSNIKFKKPAFIMHPRTWHGICEIVVATTARDFVFHVDRQPSEAVPRNILGYPVYLTTSVSIDIATTSQSAMANVFFADMDDVVLAEWEGIQIDATSIGGSAWPQYGMEIRAVAQVDVGVRNPESVCLISDTTT